MIKKNANMVPLKSISVEDSFWKNYLELVRQQVIPYQWAALNDRIEGAEPSYCIHNFRVAAGIETGSFQGMVFQDSDVYKWLEAVAYSLTWYPDPELERTADETIELIGAAQMPDGYLDTYYILTDPGKRFTNLMDHHELYCMGHMVEAAIAYFNATGKDRFLKIAVRYVNCCYSCIGAGEGKLPGYPGHEVAEMALVSLYKVTGDARHLELAKYFIDQRGQEPLYFREERKKNNNDFFWKDSYFQEQYYQAGKPVRKQSRAEGHAVRAVYLYSGMAEVAAATDDPELFEACERLWKNITEKQMYITGAIGASEYGESFTFDYDLPNDTVYAETCASIGLIFFARRMFEITGKSSYIDVMERCLYNSVISGMSLDGTKFFYVNPLEVVPEASEKDHGKAHVKAERQKWFGCACCPPNIARLLSSLGGYAYEVNDKNIFINLFIGGTAETELDGVKTRFSVKTNYPWCGKVYIRIQPERPAEFQLHIRLPEWCGKWELLVNHQKEIPSLKNGYLCLKRNWINGDEIIFDMEMPVRTLSANPRVREDIGKVGVMRGPVVYCLEEADNGSQLQELFLEDSDFEICYEPALLKGVTILKTLGSRLSEQDWSEHTLYRDYRAPVYQKEELVFIPYYAWSNRAVGEMIVWVHKK